MSSNDHAEDESGGAAAAAVSDLSFWSSAAEKTAEAELERRVESLQQELKKATEQLEQIRRTATFGGVAPSRPVTAITTKTSTTSESPIGTSTHRRPSPKALSVDDNGVPLRPPEKRGYLFKWMDRSIGWGGTKWSLRFATLQRGRLAYYGTHTDTSPRYVLSLRGFDVRDDGWKRNRRSHLFNKNTPPPPLDEPGAYFFVFSIVRRPEEDLDEEDYADLVPLLRFSTPSKTDHALWMQLISEACAYCETDEFMAEENLRDEEFARQQQQQANMAHLMPEAKEGTLPPLYFAPASASATTLRHRQRRPSVGSNTPRSSISKNRRNSLTKKTLANGDVDEADARSTLGYPPSKPMHRAAAPSFLSAEASAQHFRGLFNLGVLILIFSNIRLLLNAVRRYGLVPALLSGGGGGDENDNMHHHHHNNNRSLLDIKEEYKQRYRRHEPWQEFPFATGLCLQFVFLLVAYAMESLLAHKRVNGSVGMTLHYINAHSALVIPVYIVWNSIDNPVVGVILLLHASITWMKLVSYVHANQDYRYFSFIQIADQDDGSNNKNSNTTNNNRQKMKIARHRHHRQAQMEIENLDEQEHEIMYPQNVTLSNLFYFCCAPTLTYQIAFPKYPIVRWWKVIGIILRMSVVAVLITFLVAQVISPTLQELVKDLEATGPNGTWMEKFHVLTEYWIKLSIASTYMWLLMFYGFFHLYLNLFAELLRFGDRVFYKDWWNSSEASAFWRLWNIPVHYWLIRHVYFPCIRLKISRDMATLIVFSLSAIMHEVLVSVPFHMVRPWSFLGMMMQMPLVAVTKQLYRKYPGSSVGNIIFWISFCVVGQPMAVLLYTVDYQYHQHHLHSSSQLHDDALIANGECPSNNATHTV